MRADIAEIERSLSYIVEPRATFEVRAIDDSDNTLSGYFRDPKVAATEIAKSCGNAIGTYVTMNPAKDALFSRRANRISRLSKKGSTTSDAQIMRRRRLRFDIDATPVAGVSSTDVEHEAALYTAWLAACDLDALGFPEPIIEDSGNGAGLLYAIDEPADDGGLIARVLAAGDAKWGYSDDTVTIKIDVTNANPARITKVHGTVARKGDNTSERPHRMARIVYAPDKLETVTREQLEAFAKERTPIAETKNETATSTTSDGKKLDVAAWLTKHGIAHQKQHTDSKGRTIYVLDVCPENPEHTRGEAHVHQEPSGKIGAACKHNSCNLTWKALKQRYEPESKTKGEGRINPVKLARKYVEQHATSSEGVLLRRWRGDWYRWFLERGYYATQSDEQIDADLYRKMGLRKRSEVADVRHACLAADGVLVDAELGSWLDGSSKLDPLDLAACRNGILHLPTKKLIPATPNYFSTSALGAEFSACPELPRVWLHFLKQLWPDDDESIALLQEWMGYLLTPDTRQQKILLLLGPKRSGKGTISRVIGALLGSASVASPTLASLGTNFGLWPLIGKIAAIVQDARLGGRSDIAQVVERLLSISGEDLQTIDRKHREPWTGKLSTRITIISNEPPRFTDASDALACRMLVLELHKSFYGNEDTQLTDKLLTELPGILRWAITGWERLQKRGKFIQPEASKQAIDELIDLASPVAAWARQVCETDGTDDRYWLACADAYEKFKTWCEAQGHKQVATMTMFGRDVQTATGCRRVQVTRGTSRPWTYRGLVLRP